MGRILAGAIVGALLLFVWQYVSHMVLALTDQHLKMVPNEAAVAAAVKDNIREGGLYKVPWMDPADSKDQAKQDEMFKRYEAGPSFMIVRTPDGTKADFPKRLGLEYAVTRIATFIAALVVAAIGPRLNVLGKVVLVGLLGVLAWASQDASMWIWHDYPQEFTVAALMDAAAGWTLAGIGIAAIVRPRKVAA